jgi:hypothetical protein
MHLVHGLRKLGTARRDARCHHRPAAASAAAKEAMKHISTMQPPKPHRLAIDRRLSRRQINLAALAAAGGLVFAARPARSADRTQSKFPATVQVGGSKLQLNGAGTRHKFVFKVYDLALYTASKVTTSEQLFALPGAKYLSFIAQRELPGTELGRLFVKGLNQNATSEEAQRHTAEIARLVEVFSGRPKLVPGDNFAMEFVPGKGTTFYILGKPQGDPVGDDEFFTLVLRIWFGKEPADDLLKRDLLSA